MEIWEKWWFPFNFVILGLQDSLGFKKKLQIVNLYVSGDMLGAGDILAAGDMLAAEDMPVADMLDTSSYMVQHNVRTIFFST